VKTWIRKGLEWFCRCMMLRLERPAQDGAGRTAVWVVAYGEPDMMWLEENAASTALTRSRRETAGDLLVPLGG
jgi:hypothetical protein